MKYLMQDDVRITFVSFLNFIIFAFCKPIRVEKDDFKSV